MPAIDDRAHETHPSIHFDRQRIERAVTAIDSIQRMQDAGDVLELLASLTPNLGADHAVFVSFLRDDERLEAFRFLMAADPLWCAAYQKIARFSHDPWLAHATSSTEPRDDRGIPIRTKVQRSIRDLAATHGFVSAYVVPAPSRDPARRVGVLILGCERPEHFTGAGSTPLRILARTLSMELHEWWLRETAREFAETHRLSQEDIRLLAFERQGLSSKQIARVIEASTASVDSRFQRLNAKLGAPNRKASARLASIHGLVV